jgi:uncharacterized membrane protein YidH (DUF202 family)
MSEPLKRHVAEDEGQPEERTALAWERTAFSIMFVGTLIARQAASSVHWVFGVAGLSVVATGSAVLVWAGLRYDDLRLLPAAVENPVHTTATRLIGTLAVVVIGVATIVATLIALDA